MTPFLFAASFMCLLAVVLIILPVYRSQSRSVDRSRINVELFKERLKELGSEKERGLIDEQQFNTAVEELEKGLLTDLPSDGLSGEVTPSEGLLESRSKPYIVILTVLVIPLMSFLLYFQIGSFTEEKQWDQLQKNIKPALLGLERGEDKQAELAEYSIGEVITVLQAQLQQEEETPQGWLLLGLLYSQANKADVAAKAFEKAMLLAPDHPEIKIAYAETLLRQNEGRLTQRSAALLQSVLEKNNSNARALTLMGMGSYNSGFYEQSIAVWEQLLEIRGENSEKAPLIKQSIQMAKQALTQQMDARREPQQDGGKVSGDDDLALKVKRLQELVMRDKRLTDEIENLLKEIFSKQADNSKALAFEGMLSFNSGQYQRAINSWEELLKQREPGSERAKLIESSILKAKAQLDSQK
jgi:cytochrome c-type biogenesis protein CcmH